MNTLIAATKERLTAVEELALRGHFRSEPSLSDGSGDGSIRSKTQ